eukprot:1150529-Pelagomonas_calceolata.AAC.1
MVDTFSHDHALGRRVCISAADKESPPRCWAPSNGPQEGTWPQPGQAPLYGQEQPHLVVETVNQNATREVATPWASRQTHLQVTANA